MSRIDVGGSTNGTQQGFVVYGTTGQVRASIEGINATEATGAFGNYPDIGACRSTPPPTPRRPRHLACNRS
ncbi:MAG: hypothetical protein EXQ50_07970 [Acidobacteria bacterium]|nr:hypothetical protein [Acidobacteriota bacterium]